MKRVWMGFVVALILSPIAARGQTPAEMRRTADYAASLQNEDGGFGASADAASSLGATSSGIKVLLYTGGSIPDVPSCMAYVRKCFDKESGGFAPTPGGKPDVHTTSIGLMALGELKMDEPEMVDRAIAYLNENAREFGDIRIAVAGLEAVEKKSDRFPDWIAKVQAMRNPDGTWGEGASKAFDTGGAAVALLRLGVELDRKDAVLAAMRDGQRPDGGWSKDEGPSDLSSSYRVVRGFFMMREKPDLSKLLGFIARHRNADGGYGTEPGGASSLSGTYYATIMIRWSRILRGEPALVETAGFVPLFDGKSLDGWEGDTTLWKVREGMIVGDSPGIEHNNFLATEKSYGDFILKLSFRLVGGVGNSGVQFRSVRIEGGEMRGYQADIGENYWGCLYDESRRNKVLVQASRRAEQALHKDGWNEYVLRVIGGHIRLTLNGVTSVDYEEPDADIARDGKIALQIHAGGPMQVQFKDIYIQPLPRPTADEAKTPGFHLRIGPERRKRAKIYRLSSRRLRRREVLPGDPLPARFGRTGRQRHSERPGGPRADHRRKPR